MKKTLVILLSLALIAACFIGCAESTVTVDPDSLATPTAANDPSADDGAEAPGEDVTVLRFALQSAVESLPTKSAEDAAAEIEELSGGTLQIDVYPAQQLGDWTTVYDELMLGTIDMAVISVPDTYDARISAGFLPYLATSYDEAREVFAPDNYLCTKMAEFEAEQGIEFFGFYFEGFCGVLSNKELTNANVSNADKGLLIRVPATDAWNFPFQRLGFKTSTIPYSDAYSALQTGLVDGFTGGPAYGIYESFRDVGTYYYCYDVVAESLQVLMSKTIYDGLTEEQQQALRTGLENLSAHSFDEAEENEITHRQLLEEAGIQIIEFTDEEKAAMAENVRTNVWNQLSATFTEEFLEELAASY